MINLIGRYLKENIDDNIQIVKWKKSHEIPIHLQEVYQFHNVTILGKECLLLELGNTEYGIEILKKHLAIIKKHANEHLVLIYRTISIYRKKTLMQNQIPFIVENSQAYLPFIYLDLKLYKSNEKSNSNKFPPITQLVFLYFLYNEELLVNATILAKLLNISIMSASRALNDLYLLGLITYELSGKTQRSKMYQRIKDPEYYRFGKDYLVNPVKSVVYIDSKENNLLVAGIEALSLTTLLNPPKRKVRAIYKQKVNEMTDQIIDDQAQIVDKDTIEVQLWEYDPLVIAQGQVVDIVSLVLSIDNPNDERVELSIQERLKKEKWYME